MPADIVRLNSPVRVTSHRAGISNPVPAEEKFVEKRSVSALIMMSFEKRERACLAVRGKHSSG